jgi:methylenetetrahydrofolate--tRNA-(uracil-5-)-methyltransferase
MNSSGKVNVIGGGLAGTECAYQLARLGVEVDLFEMRPERTTPAHGGDRLAELVCSNSLRSDDPHHAAGLLKREMEAFGSLIIGAARASAVPAGSALAVDRDLFAALVTETIETTPGIHLHREEIATPTTAPGSTTVIATGPLTSPALSTWLQGVLGEDHLFFYDAIAPIVDAESLDESKLFRASRWDKGDGDDYLNAPMSQEQYDRFYDALVAAEVVPLRDFEQNLFFEGCLPIEEMARRGRQTLTFGPMKPVGLRPPDGSRPYAVVQLRQENLSRSLYNLVGFQSRMSWGAQKQVLALIPGLEAARFERMGQIHRNTFVNAPEHLDAHYRLRNRPEVRLAGQITGVEGYLESAATGLLNALYIALDRHQQGSDPKGEPELLPETTALGALARHLTQSEARNFQPANINYGLFLPLEGRIKKRERRTAYAERAQTALEAWITRQPLELRARFEAEPLKGPGVGDLGVTVA